MRAAQINVPKRRYLFQMAKPHKNSNGIWTLKVQYQGRVKKLTLGLIDKTTANSFAANSKILVDYRRRNQALPNTIAAWLSDLSPTHFEQLADLGLVASRERKLNIDQLIDLYLSWYETELVETNNIHSSAF